MNFIKQAAPMTNQTSTISQPIVLDSDSSDDLGCRHAYVSSLLSQTQEGVVRVTKNLSCDRVWVPTSLPTYLPAAPGGIETVLSIATSGPLAKVSLDGVSTQTFSDRITSGVPYSVRMRNDRKTSTIRLGTVSYPVRRVVGSCSGVNTCICSKTMNSVRHEGVQEGRRPPVPTPQFEADPALQSLHKARELFWFAQATYPSFCSHSAIHMRTEGQRAHRTSLQYRSPNWEFVPGATRNGSSMTEDGVWAPPTKMPDFIGCADFGNLGVQERSGCTVVVVPEHLHGASMAMVDALVTCARRGNFPSPPDTAENQCVSLPTSFGGSYCRNSAVHGYQTVPISTIHCSVRYQFLIHEMNGTPAWAIIIGYGAHKHVMPFHRPTPYQMQRVVEEILEVNPRAQTRYLMNQLVAAYGSRPSLATVQRRKYNFQVQRNPFGRHLAGLIRLRHDCPASPLASYVWYITDERLSDEKRDTVHQIGIVIIMGNMDLLKRSISSPHYACDGTFSMVSQSGDKLSYELVSMTCKDPLTGRMYCPFRAIASRKTSGARNIILRAFVHALRNAGLEDPLVAEPSKRLTLATDFETTFAQSAGNVLASIFRPDGDMQELSARYVEKVAFGCGVHAKRMVLEKVNILRERNVYLWLVGTRMLESCDEITAALHKMVTINVKLGHFARWLCQNKTAYVLWFWMRYKTTTPGIYRRILWSTNISEAEHSVLKGSSDYLLTKCKGLDLVSLTKFLCDHDQNEFSNINGDIGIPLVETPLLNRTRRKRKLNSCATDGYVIQDGVFVTASQPKRAKRSKRGHFLVRF